MAAFVLGVVLAMVAMGAGTPVWHPPPPPDAAPSEDAIEAADLVELVAGATHRVSSFGCTALGNGTAVAVADGLLLTNRHVVTGARLINVSADLGPTKVATAEVHPGMVDLAELTVSATGDPALAVADEDAEPGARLLTAGFEEDELGLTVRPTRLLAYVEGIDRGHPGPVMQLDIDAVQGMSGGPVVNEAGELAGILFAVEDPPGTALAIPASAIDASLTAEEPFVPDPGCGVTPGVRSAATPVGAEPPPPGS